MSTHIIEIRASDTFRGVVLLAECSCGRVIKGDDSRSLTLAELNEIAHEHIEQDLQDRVAHRADEMRRGWDRALALTGEITLRSDPYLSGDVAGQEYVHGLDPVSKDPRRGVLDP